MKGLFRALNNSFSNEKKSIEVYYLTSLRFLIRTNGVQKDGPK